MPSVVAPSAHYYRGDHAEHSVIGLGVRENVAVKCPDSFRLAVHDYVPTLAGSDVQRIAFPRSGDGPSILCDHSHVHSVKVHGMNHHAFIHEPNAKLLSLFRSQGLGCRKALSIEGVSVSAVVEDERVIDICTLDLRRIFRLDDKSAE